MTSRSLVTFLRLRLGGTSSRSSPRGPGVGMAPGQDHRHRSCLGARSPDCSTESYPLDVSSRLDKSWRVLASPSTPAVDRCVDIFVRPDGTFGFEEFRRDPEDMGIWTPIAYYSTREFFSQQDAVDAAREAVLWLAEVLDHSN